MWFLSMNCPKLPTFFHSAGSSISQIDYFPDYLLLSEASYQQAKIEIPVIHHLKSDHTHICLSMGPSMVVDGSIKHKTIGESPQFVKY